MSDARARRSGGRDAPLKSGKASTSSSLRRTEMKRDGRRALSIGRFINARASTYDKREVIKKSAAELAAKNAKYARLQRKLKGTYEANDDFDPEVYAKRLATIDDPTLARQELIKRQGLDEQEKATTSNTCAESETGKDSERVKGQRTVKPKKKKFDPLKKAWEKGQTIRDEREAQKRNILETQEKRRVNLAHQRDARLNKKQLMRKKNARGQPVMKHRVQNILDKLQAEIH
jgi:hypothetical protein